MDQGSSARMGAELAPLRRYARALTRDAPRADDLVQETVLRAIESQAGYQPHRSLAAWLRRIMRNQFIDWRRREAAEQRRDERFSEVLGERSAPAAQEHAALLREVAARFAALPEAQRAVLQRVAVDGLTYRETADALGLPIGTVMSRLSRARAALRESSQPDGAVLRVVGGADG